MFLGLDPGKSKCGLAVMDFERKLWLQEVVPTSRTIERIEKILADYPISVIVLGNGTGSQSWRQLLEPQVRVVVIDEKFSTLEARQRYWQLYPPQGIFKLLPPSWRIPPRPFDDVVAVVLIERYLKQLVTE
ncbi:MAG: pre-16S rRNA-processing nuclease YqgF [Pseudanabaenaceae cyanobacterium]